MIGNNQKSAFLEDDDFIALGNLANRLQGIGQELEVRNENLDDSAPCLVNFWLRYKE